MKQKAEIDAKFWSTMQAKERKSIMVGKRVRDSLSSRSPRSGSV